MLEFQNKIRILSLVKILSSFDISTVRFDI